MLMGVVDTVMVGQVSPAALASVALGNMYFFSILDLRNGRAVRARPDRRAGARRARRARRAPRPATRPHPGARDQRADCARAAHRAARARARRPAARSDSRCGRLRASQRALGVGLLRVRGAAANAASAPPRVADRYHGRRREPRQCRAQLRVDLRPLRFSGDGRDRFRVGHHGEPLVDGGDAARARLAHARSPISRTSRRICSTCAHSCAWSSSGCRSARR